MDRQRDVFLVIAGLSCWLASEAHEGTANRSTLMLQAETWTVEWVNRRLEAAAEDPGTFNAADDPEWIEAKEYVARVARTTLDDPEKGYVGTCCSRRVPGSGCPCVKKHSHDKMDCTPWCNEPYAGCDADED